MSDSKSISINITIDTGNHPIHDPPAPEPVKPSNDQFQCDLFYGCTDPECFERGCALFLNKISKKGAIQ